jgi:pimeloyl-ACP methyl ester carboxylesterase
MQAVTSYRPAAGLQTRGSVILVAGRGETRATYARFGARLAYDAYQVGVVDPPTADAARLDAYLSELARLLSDAVTSAASHGVGGLVRPLVLAGSDEAAAGIAALVARADEGSLWWPDAVVLAGLPGYDLRACGGWDDELVIRTHCPVHRDVLGSDAAVRRGRLGDAVPTGLLDAAYQSAAAVPHLLLVGDEDRLADRAATAHAAKALPNARLVVVRGAHHDVLNDLQHRSVAAEVVSFLEALRTNLVPAVWAEVSAW